MICDKNRNRKGGFSLVEILVTIAIIGLLSTVVVASVTTARTKAKIARTHADLREIHSAITLLEEDTIETVNHYQINVNGCPSSVGPNELYLDTTAAGIEQTDGLFPNWDGPYFRNVPDDPWGNRYIFDDDYACVAGVIGCNGITGDTRAIHSGGPNGSGIDVNDSDNIVRVMCSR